LNGIEFLKIETKKENVKYLLKKKKRKEREK